MKLTPEKQSAFLHVLSDGCNVGKACAAVGISRQTAYNWREDDPEFAIKWDRALKIGVSALEDEAHRRAFEGVADPLTHQGQFTYEWEEERDAYGNIVRDEDGTPRMVRVRDANGQPKIATVQKYSDTLAIFLLKAHDPEKYRENSKIELAGQVEIASAIVAARKRRGG